MEQDDRGLSRAQLNRSRRNLLKVGLILLVFVIASEAFPQWVPGWVSWTLLIPSLFCIAAGIRSRILLDQCGIPRRTEDDDDSL